MYNLIVWKYRGSQCPKFNPESSKKRNREQNAWKDSNEDFEEYESEQLGETSFLSNRSIFKTCNFLPPGWLDELSHIEL